MDKQSSCILKFHDYIIRKMSFQVHPTYFTPDPDQASLATSVRHDVSIDEKNQQASVTLELSIGLPNEEKPNPPFTIHVVLEGFFSYHADGNVTPTFDRVCNVNATAILFPYLRSIVTDITKIANVNPPLIIPPVNINKLLKHDDKTAG
ncbi:protein-export chaperone SecB [Sporolituus thermophilus]|uniref:Preprotein translocase subunit SecB n=1 Tax=Sporolituus thermophilus DSM 23256 TaxID=1123285 RepID=A0A1G7L862_9FIRM|nr:protein-export chaperone SecB [Sporolituus thermophilus]SDF45643.1 preprotein translocase subunit SecB [Sporolituus thermophilus DSM 23256]